MTRAELLERMPATEFYAWQVIERVEPFGEQAAYFRAGIIAATIANVNRSKETRAYSPQDFMPRFEPVKNQTAEEQYEIMMLLKRSLELAKKTNA